MPRFTGWYNSHSPLGWVKCWDGVLDTLSDEKKERLNQSIRICQGQRRRHWFWMSKVSLWPLDLKTVVIWVTQRKLMGSALKYTSSVLPPLKLPICFLHRLFYVPCFYSLVTLFVLGNKQESKFTLFPVCCRVGFTHSNKEKKPFSFFFSGSKKQPAVSENHIRDIEGKEKLCRLFSCSHVMFYQGRVACLACPTKAALGNLPAIE